MSCEGAGASTLPHNPSAAGGSGLEASGMKSRPGWLKGKLPKICRQFPNTSGAFKHTLDIQGDQVLKR